jgi:hypothetical protein
MLTKEEEFKQRFVALMQDLGENHKDNPEAMFLVGSLASRLIDRAQQKSWSAYKSSLSEADFVLLLDDFQKKGNAFYAEGKDKHTYALQLLAMSVIARKQNDPDVRAGNRLLDDLVGFYVDAYRKAEKMKPT